MIPGHFDPHIGTYRSDAPTTSWVAAHVAVLGMSGETCDVRKATGNVDSCQSSELTVYLLLVSVPKYARGNCDGF